MEEMGGTWQDSSGVKSNVNFQEASAILALKNTKLDENKILFFIFILFPLLSYCNLKVINYNCKNHKREATKVQILCSFMVEKNIKVDTMIKFDRLPENIHKLLPKAKVYLNGHPKVIFAYLFGSLAKGKPTPLSDVDIAVYLSEESDAIQVKMELLGKLMELLETDEIDLTILNTASLPLTARGIENKILLVDKKPFLRHSFESLILREYFDFSRKEMEILQRRYSVGRQVSNTEKIK